MTLPITEVHARIVEHALRADRRVVSAAGAHDRSRYLVVALEDADGRRGFGEAATTAAWSGETAETAQHLVEHRFAPVVTGRPWEHPAGLADALEKIVRGHPFTRSALDTAAWDLWARRQGRAVSDLVADRAPVAAVPSRASIGAYPLERTLALAEAFHAAGIRTFKFKTGVTVADDATRLRAVRDRLGPEVTFTVDYNGAFTDADAACRAIEALAPVGVALVEQPTHRDRPSLMAQVRRRCEPPVLADEAVFSPADLEEALDLDAFDLLSVYPGKNGGFTRALAMAQRAQQAGKTCAVGSNLETDLGLAAMVTLAASLAAFPVDELPCDLASSLYYETSSVTEPLELRDGALVPPAGPGFGVTPLAFREDHESHADET